MFGARSHARKSSKVEKFRLHSGQRISSLPSGRSIPRWRLLFALAIFSAILYMLSSSDAFDVRFKLRFAQLGAPRVEYPSDTSSPSTLSAPKEDSILFQGWEVGRDGKLVVPLSSDGQNLTPRRNPKMRIRHPLYDLTEAAESKWNAMVERYASCILRDAIESLG